MFTSLIVAYPGYLTKLNHLNCCKASIGQDEPSITNAIVVVLMWNCGFIPVVS